MALIPGRGSAGAQESVQVRALTSLDLERYSGRWYEVARLPNRFQRRCVAEVTADYELQPDSSLRIVNGCRTGEGDHLRAEGKARLADRRGPASRLKVRFAPAVLSFLPMVWADYWVLDLTDDYAAALVGTPDRRYLWVLSRTPTLDETVYQRLIETATRQGFDVSNLVRSAAP
jgi:apolipoprotein D and lipocalin family protein